MIDDEELEHRTHQLLAEAAHLYRGNQAIHETFDRFTEPLRLAVAGPAGSGKSTLVNALVGEDVAPVAAGGDFVAYRDGTHPRAWWHAEGGLPYEVPMVPADHGLRLSVDGPAAPGTRVVVEWPSRVLRRTQLIDTRGPVPFARADAVLYVTPHVDETHLLELRAGRGIRGPSVFPVQTMVVLSRADETGGGNAGDVLRIKQIARRRRSDPRIGALCQDMLAVSPLIGHAARTLRDEEFRAIATLAQLPREEVGPYLLSTDRFTAAGSLGTVGADQRARLLQRFGMGGIRHAIVLARHTATSTAALSELLAEYSGLTYLQSSIAELFTARRALLKARSALTALDHLLRSLPEAGPLLARLELLVAETHEFRELRLLSAIRCGRVNLPADIAVDARRLLGGSGISVGERLGVPAEAGPAEIWARANEAADRWRSEVYRRDQEPAQRRAAEIVLRSCDMILARLDRMAAPAE